jgi:hypothetical protein
MKTPPRLLNRGLYFGVLIYLRDWEDRAAALKAIADLGTPESVDFLQTERTRLQPLTDAESVRSKELIGLYLN